MAHSSPITSSRLHLHRQTQWCWLDGASSTPPKHTWQGSRQQELVLDDWCSCSLSHWGMPGKRKNSVLRESGREPAWKLTWIFANHCRFEPGQAIPKAMPLSHGILHFPKMLHCHHSSATSLLEWPVPVPCQRPQSILIASPLLTLTPTPLPSIEHEKHFLSPTPCISVFLCSASLRHSTPQYSDDLLKFILFAGVLFGK